MSGVDMRATEEDVLTRSCFCGKVVQAIEAGRSLG
jgi:hypothetical protein